MNRIEELFFTLEHEMNILCALTEQSQTKEALQPQKWSRVEKLLFLDFFIVSYSIGCGQKNNGKKSEKEDEKMYPS